VGFHKTQPAKWFSLLGKKWLITWNVVEVEDSDDFLYLSAVVAAADSHRQFLFGNALVAGGILDDAIQKFREVIRFKPQSKMPTWAWCARSLRPGVRTKL